MILSTFSCVCWPSVCLLWRNVYLGLLSNCGLGCLFFFFDIELHELLVNFGDLPSSFIFCVFLCLLILFNLLCLGFPFCSLQVHSSSYFWCPSPVGEVGSVACIGFLMGRTDACVLVGRAASSGVFWGVCELSMILGSLSAKVWGCVPVLLVVWHGVSITGACWPLGGAGS